MFSMSFFSVSFLLAMSLSAWFFSSLMRTSSFICISMRSWRILMSASLAEKTSLVRSNSVTLASSEAISLATSCRSVRYSLSFANLPESLSFLCDMCRRSMSALSAAVL